MIHILITLVAVFIAYLVGSHVEVALACACFYIGREHAQAEYRSITTWHGNKRMNAPWWCGFEPRVWDKKSVLDWLLPVLLLIVVWSL